MQLALEGHGIRSNDRLRNTLSYRGERVLPTEAGALLSGRFFVDVKDEGLWATYRAQFGHKIPRLMEDVETICRHEFNLLGSGAYYWGTPIDWHLDPVSGYRWSKKFFFDLKRTEISTNGQDIKVPWELSRMQHLPTLGKAYRLTKDERYAQEIVGQLSHWLHDNPCPYGVNWTMCNGCGDSGHEYDLGLPIHRGRRRCDQGFHRPPVDFFFPAWAIYPL